MRHRRLTQAEGRVPLSPPHPCPAPGCPALTRDRYCPQHRRGSAASRGYDLRWRRYRIAFLKQHPLCVICEAEGRTTLATVVDHITPARGDARLFWDTSRHQALCAACHGKKTGREDGGFGHPIA